MNTNQMGTHCVIMDGVRKTNVKVQSYKYSHTNTLCVVSPCVALMVIVMPNEQNHASTKRCPRGQYGPFWVLSTFGQDLMDAMEGTVRCSIERTAPHVTAGITMEL